MAILRNHPNLKHFKGEKEAKVKEELIKAHRFLMSDKSGTLGYLYQEQIRLKNNS